MIRITRETDYGIVLLAEMARHSRERAHSAREVAGWVGISVPLASKILKGLARAGILLSNRGAKGGYALARPLDRMSIADVINAIEGPIGLVECVAHPGLCEQEPNCPTSVNWKRLNQALRDAMESVAISDLLDPSPSPFLKLGSRVARNIRAS